MWTRLTAAVSEKTSPSWISGFQAIHICSMTVWPMNATVVAQLRPNLSAPFLSMLARPKMLRYLLLSTICAACLAGCANPGLYKGAYGFWTQEGYEGYSTRGGLCTRGKESVDFAAQATAVIVDEMVKAKVIADSAALLAKIKDRRPHVCVLDAPRPCGNLYTTLGPCKVIDNGKLILCARRAGCAGDYWVWQSDTWPFTCDSRWPEEPNCTRDSTAIKTGLWKAGLLHELFHLALRLSVNVLDASHRDAVYAVEKTVAERLKRKGTLP